MENRPLGRSGLEATPIALGCWQMGGDRWWGPADDNESIGCIHEAIELGINLIDTAPAYGTGHAEEIVGKALIGRRDCVLIASKCGLIPNPDAPYGVERCLTRKSILAECEASLRRLRTDRIDLYQCHWPDPATPITETMEAMNRLLQQGKIRAIGLSNHSCEQVSAARKLAAVHTLQPEFSMLKRASAEELIPYCQEHHIAVLAYSPLCRGLLSGKLTPESTFNDLRRDDPDFSGERFRKNLRKVAQLAEIARRYDRSMVQLAANWVIYYPGVTVAIVGAKRASQIREATPAVGWTVSAEDKRRIDEILRA